MLNNHLSYVPCNLCGSEDYKVLFKTTLTDDDFKNSYKQYVISERSFRYGQIVQCKKCNLVYANPRDNTSDMIRNYTLAKDENYFSEWKAREAVFLRGLRLIEKYAVREGRLLDLGCFTGAFLNLIRKHNWAAMGIEPSQWAADYGRTRLNLKILQGTLEDFELDGEFFDVATMWDVIEHIPNPKSTLSLLNQKLKKGGILYLTTFNFDSIFRKLFGSKYWFFEQMHIYHFTPRTITRMLEECNYKVIKIDRNLRIMSPEYFIFRLREVSKFLAKIIAPISSSRLFKKRNIAAYAGEMIIIAQKR